MSAIVAFDFNGFHTVRVRTDDEGAPWWIAKDVCDVLGIRNSRQALSYLDDDEKGGVISNDVTGREQEMTTVNESGLYSLILRSRKPEAKAFKRWITHDVLPALRQTGRYGIEGSNVEYRLDALAERIDELAAETRRRMSDMREETASFFVRTRMNAPMPALAMPKLSDAPTTGKGKRVLMLEIKARLAELARRGNTKIPPLYNRAVSDYSRYFGADVIQEAQRFNKEPLDWIEKHGDVDVLHMIVHGYPLE